MMEAKETRGWTRMCAGIMVALFVVIAGLSTTAFAAGPENKPNLDGYTGPDAQYIVNPLPNPVMKPGYKFTVGYLNVFNGISVLYEIQKACEKKVRAMGGEFIGYDGKLDIQQQVSQMEQLISRKVDIIIAYPITEAGLGQAAAAAKKAGIPVVLISTPSSSEQPMDPNATAMVGMAFDQYDYVTMKIVAQKYPHGKMAVLGFGPPSENLVHILARSKYWANQMGINILGQVDALDPSPTAATVATQAIMGKYPDVQVILGYNDYATNAAAMALRASGKTGVVVVTPNGGSAINVPALKSGAVLTAYRNPWEDLGEAAAITAYDILTKQPIPQKRMLFTGKPATKENVNSLTFVQ